MNAILTVSFSEFCRHRSLHASRLQNVCLTISYQCTYRVTSLERTALTLPTTWQKVKTLDHCVSTRETAPAATTTRCVATSPQPISSSSSNCSRSSSPSMPKLVGWWNIL